MLRSAVTTAIPDFPERSRVPRHSKHELMQESSVVAGRGRFRHACRARAHVDVNVPSLQPGCGTPARTSCCRAEAFEYHQAQRREHPRGAAGAETCTRHAAALAGVHRPGAVPPGRRDAAEAAQQLNDVRDAEVLVRVFSRLRDAFKDEPRRPTWSPCANYCCASGAFRLARAARASCSCQDVTGASEGTNPGLVRHERCGPADERDAENLPQRSCLLSRCLRVCDRRAPPCVAQAGQILCLSTRSSRLAGACADDEELRRSAQLAKVARQGSRPLHVARSDRRCASRCSRQLRLTAAIRRERADLQRRALQRGKRLYRSKPRKFQPLN